VNPGGRGIGGFSEYVQETARARDGAVFANLVDLESIRTAMRDFLGFFDRRTARRTGGAPLRRA
jgi:hypothetical protein